MARSQRRNDTQNPPMRQQPASPTQGDAPKPPIPNTPSQDVAAISTLLVVATACAIVLDHLGISPAFLAAFAALVSAVLSGRKPLPPDDEQSDG